MPDDFAAINDMLQEANRKRSCEGKIQHTMLSAHNEAKRLENASTVGEVFDYYECIYCHSWHVGHNIKSPRSKKPVRLLVSVYTISDNTHVTHILGYTGSRDAYEAAMSVRIKGIPNEIGTYVFTGALIYGRNAMRTIVGQSVPLADEHDNINWRYHDDATGLELNNKTKEIINNE